MTTIETSDFQRQFHEAEIEITGPLANVRLDPYPGGLVIIGPNGGTLAGLDTLLSVPGIEPVEAMVSRLATWQSATAETVEVGRAVSRAIRSGRTAVVYLDSHVGDAAPIAEDQHAFVCMRLSQLMIGVNDVPSYVALHGEQMAQAMVIDSLGEQRLTELGSIAGDCPVWQLSEHTMFPGVITSMCPAGGDGTSMNAMLTWLESRRS